MSSTIKYKIEQDDEMFAVIATKDGTRIGALEVVLNDSSSGCFDLYSDAQCYEKIKNQGVFVEIRNVDVASEFQQQGIGSELMRRAAKLINKLYSNMPIFINASPMGDIDLGSLIKFYKKYGFKTIALYKKHNNAALWKEAA